MKPIYIEIERLMKLANERKKQNVQKWKQKRILKK